MSSEEPEITGTLREGPSLKWQVLGWIEIAAGLMLSARVLWGLSAMPPASEPSAFYIVELVFRLAGIAIGGILVLFGILLLRGWRRVQGLLIAGLVVVALLVLAALRL